MVAARTPSTDAILDPWWQSGCSLRSLLLVQRHQHHAVAQQLGMSLPFPILLPELDPLLPRERHSRRERAAGIDRPSFDCFAVFAPWPELILVVAEVVGERLAVAVIRPDNKLMIRDVVAGNVCRQQRSQLLADDVNS